MEEELERVRLVAGVSASLITKAIGEVAAFMPII